MTRDERIESFKKLESLVNARGITIYKVAQDVGLAKNMFSDWKSGRSMPKTEKLIPLARYFGVSVEYFVE